LESDSVPNSKLADKLNEMARLQYNLVVEFLSKLLHDVFAQSLLQADLDISKLLEQFGESVKTASNNLHLI
jgi:hypothetical protein